jgi:hypothetical protein
VPWRIWRAAAVIRRALPILQLLRRPVGMNLTILSRNERHFAAMDVVVVDPYQKLPVGK